MAGRGFNTVHGFDQGPPPPGYPGGFPGGIHGFPSPSYPPPPYGWPQQQQQPFYPTPQPFYPPYGGFGMGGQTWPAVPPMGDSGFPGIHLRNDTGGVGLPPGYDYAFPTEHTKIHVFKTKEKPWQIQIYKENNAAYSRLFVPSNTTVKELMQNLGCTNSDAGKNILYEITEKGNGHWASGLRIKGDDKDKVKKTIADFGWNKERTGHPGAKPVVWLWVTNEGL